MSIVTEQEDLSPHEIMAMHQRNIVGGFQVYRHGAYPKKKRHFYPNKFETRRKARRFCKNRDWVEGLTIVHPDGKEEPYGSKE